MKEYPGAYLLNCLFSWTICQSKQFAIFSGIIALNMNGPWYLVHGFSVDGRYCGIHKNKSSSSI